MPEIPRLTSERLVLRAFTLDDGPVVEQLAGVREVADTTLSIPHPYPAGGGASWIGTHADAWNQAGQLALAICQRTGSRNLVGAISVHVEEHYRHGEIGYWIGKEQWGKGYATEAARALVAYAFTELGLHRLQARHFLRNPASGRVLQKVGMKLEGVHRDAYIRWGQFESVALYAILEPEWRAMQ
ncbi:MAG TPA: GNAT family protein [Gemmatimonadaceae bacterium]|jgi:RimJ/RimL family protein N-acetyltransferase